LREGRKSRQPRDRRPHDLQRFDALLAESSAVEDRSGACQVGEGDEGLHRVPSFPILR